MKRGNRVAGKRDQRIARKSRRVVVGICLLLLVPIIVALILSRPASDAPLENQSLDYHPEASVVDHSPKELEKFWQNHMRRAVELELMSYQCPIPEIRERYAFLSGQVKAKYGTVNIELSSAARPLNSNTFAGTSFSNGVPHITFFIANSKNAFETDFAKLSETERQKTFDFVTVLGIIHEYEHIAGDPPRIKGAPYSVDDLVAAEKHAWAETCKYTLGPCIEKYGYKYFPLIRGYYTGWVNSGRDENSASWEAFIRSVYRSAKTIPDDGNLPQPPPLTNVITDKG